MPDAVWSHEWDRDTGCLRLLRDGCCYSSLGRGLLPGDKLPPGTEVDRARKAARYLFDMCNELLSDDHGWGGGVNIAEVSAIMAMAHRALGDLLTLTKG